MHPYEKLEVMGFNVFDNIDGQGGSGSVLGACPFKHRLFGHDVIAHSVIARLVGNSMCASAVGTVLLYLLACADGNEDNQL